MTCGRMQMYPGQVYHSPLVIKPSGTEPYYTRMQIYQNADIPRSDVHLVIDLSVP